MVSLQFVFNNKKESNFFKPKQDVAPGPIDRGR